MPRQTEKTNIKVTGIMSKLQDDNEFLEMAKDELLSYGRQTKPNDIASGTADVDSMKSFLEVDFFEIPAGIRCPICWDTCSHGLFYIGGDINRETSASDRGSRRQLSIAARIENSANKDKAQDCRSTSQPAAVKSRLSQQIEDNDFVEAIAAKLKKRFAEKDAELTRPDSPDRAV
ncbi:hypothetical protein DAPPUDRAFT_114605 [Daphnia pulex]|uniref:Uncharacterized protein n=1 Tax=Daphnia pulex TaxID=6669 RepID=E9HIQ5_DAPPU|nr:hypothetical protein DAPPUDRAFT_114605 [Daphnia pulex]|eukprot:EFX68394.1 hypothetical protein DAPPUDRAFT_114605 [Daphnia pulex]